MSFNSYQFMQRSFNERINSHWVRGCFGEDWQESFRQRDLAKDQALIGVWGHPVVQYQPLCSEWDRVRASHLRVKFSRSKSLADLVRNNLDSFEAVRQEILREADKHEAGKCRVSKLEGIDLGKVKSAVAKHATPGPHPGPNRSSPKQKELQGRRKVKPKRREKKVGIDPYAPLADHLEGYIKKQVKEKKLPQPEVVTATKALIEKRVEEFKSQATSLADLEDAKLWRLKMHNALEALLKNGRVHEFIN